MHRLWGIVTAAIAILLVTAGAGRAETRVALVVGNSAYVNTTPLANPLNDARDMVAALKGAGFDVVEAFDADKRRIDQALRTFTDKLARADVALFFYAGHGLQVGAQNYLVPIDATLERERDLDFEAVKLDFVLRQMEIDREGKTSIVFLDACRDNPLSRNLARSMGTRSAGIGRGLAAAATGLGTFIAYATQPGNVALDGDGRNSPFTSALIKHMGAAGRNLPATMIEVRKNVVAATNGRQVPWDHSALTGDFYFVPGAGGSPSSPSAAGSASAPSPSDFAALQDRLRKLEEEAKRKEASAGSSIGADAIKLAELRARAASLEELTRDLQRKFMASLTAQARAGDKDEKAKLSRDSQAMQMELGRRNLDLARLKAEISALEGGGQKGTQTASAADLPVIPRSQPQKDSSSFEQTDNVGLVGTEMRSFRAASPVACRDVCEADASCSGYQHGRKLPVMGTCTLFSSVTARREDDQWRSGVRNVATQGARQSRIVFPAPVTRTKQGFHIYEGVRLRGKGLDRDDVNTESADACLTVCKNSPGCAAARFWRIPAGADPSYRSCSMYSVLDAVEPDERSTAIVRKD